METTPNDIKNPEKFLRQDFVKTYVNGMVHNYLVRTYMDEEFNPFLDGNLHTEIYFAKSNSSKFEMFYRNPVEWDDFDIAKRWHETIVSRIKEINDEKSLRRFFSSIERTGFANFGINTKLDEFLSELLNHNGQLVEQ